MPVLCFQGIGLKCKTLICSEIAWFCIITSTVIFSILYPEAWTVWIICQLQFVHFVNIYFKGVIQLSQKLPETSLMQMRKIVLSGGGTVHYMGDIFARQNLRQKHFWPLICVFLHHNPYLFCLNTSFFRQYLKNTNFYY